MNSSFISGKRLRQVLALTWPAVLQGMVTTLVFTTDRLIIGRYASEALSALAIANPVAWSVTSIFGAFMAGVVAVTGRAVGADNPRKAAATLRASLSFALLVGLLVSLLAFVARDPIVAVLTGDAATSAIVRDNASTYLAIVLTSAPLFFIGATATASLQAAGDTRTPMLIAIVAGLANLGISWVLVFGQFGAPELGLMGAAVGTVCSSAVQAAGGLLVLQRGRGPLQLSAEHTRQDRRDVLATVLRVSRATLGEKLLYHAAFVASIAIVGHLGDVALAAHETLLGIEAIGFTAAGGFSIAASSLVATRMGREDPDEAYRSGQTAAGLGLVIGVAFGGLLFLFPRPLVGIFTTDPEVIDTGAQCLRIAALAQPAMILADTWSGSLRGAGDTLTPMISALLGPVVMRLSACWFFAWHLEMGLVGFWLGTTLDWYVRAVWTGVAFWRRRWQQTHREL